MNLEKYLPQEKKYALLAIHLNKLTKIKESNDKEDLLRKREYPGVDISYYVIDKKGIFQHENNLNQMIDLIEYEYNIHSAKTDIIKDKFILSKYEIEKIYNVLRLTLSIYIENKDTPETSYDRQVKEAYDICNRAFQSPDLYCQIIGRISRVKHCETYQPDKTKTNMNCVFCNQSKLDHILNR